MIFFLQSQYMTIVDETLVSFPWLSRLLIIIKWIVIGHSVVALFSGLLVTGMIYLELMEDKFSGPHIF